MNEQTQQLIEKLAEKLGTTAEHLWGALIKQAPISSTVDLISIAICAAALVAAFNIIKSKVEDEDFAVIVWSAWGSIAFLIAMASLCILNRIVAGFFNPEYWAIKEIIGK